MLDGCKLICLQFIHALDVFLLRFTRTGPSSFVRILASMALVRPTVRRYAIAYTPTRYGAARQVVRLALHLHVLTIAIVPIAIVPDSPPRRARAETVPTAVRCSAWWFWLVAPDVWMVMLRVVTREA